MKYFNYRIEDQYNSILPDLEEFTNKFDNSYCHEAFFSLILYRKDKKLVIAFDTNIFQKYCRDIEFIALSLRSFLSFLFKDDSFSVSDIIISDSSELAYVEFEFNSEESSLLAWRKLLGSSITVVDLPILKRLSFKIYDESLKVKFLRSLSKSYNVGLYVTCIHIIGFYNATNFFALPIIGLIFLFFSIAIITKHYDCINIILKFYCLFILVSFTFSWLAYLWLAILLILKYCCNQENWLLIVIRNLFIREGKGYYPKKLAIYVFDTNMSYVNGHSTLIIKDRVLLSISWFFLHVNLVIIRIINL